MPPLDTRNTRTLLETEVREAEIEMNKLTTELSKLLPLFEQRGLVRSGASAKSANLRIQLCEARQRRNHYQTLLKAQRVRDRAAPEQS